MNKLKTLIITLMIAVFIMSPICVRAYSLPGYGFYGMLLDTNGDRYIIQGDKMQFGIIHFRGAWYYAYKTESDAHARGSLCTKSFRRLSKGKWKYYRSNGKGLERDSKYINIDEDNAIINYIYPQKYKFERRFNAKKERYEIRDKTTGQWRVLKKGYLYTYDKQMQGFGVRRSKSKGKLKIEKEDEGV